MRQYKTLRGLFSQPERWTQGFDFGKRLADYEVTYPSTRSHANCFCLVGGMRVVYPNVKERHQVQHKLWETIQKLFTINASSGHVSADIINWNDAPERNIEDVQQVVREAKV